MGYKKDAIKGVGWIGTFRVITRFSAFIRTAILARILIPAQFGLFGVASLVLSFLEIFTETGINVFLIQEKEDIDDYISTAWVISIVRGIFMFVVIFLFSSLIAEFFNSDSAILIKLIAYVALIRGFINPSIVKLQKELKFNKHFYYKTSVYLVDAVVTISLALLYKTASSLVLGLLAGAFYEVIISFLITSPRPRFEFDKVKFSKIIKRGKWVTLFVIFSYLTEESDDAVVAKILDSASLGLYQVAYKISTLPLTEITQVMGTVTFPIYTKISEDKKRVREAFMKTWLTISMVILPMSIFIFIFPKEIILIVLGSNWLGAVGVLRVLAVFGLFKAIITAPNALFNSLRKQEWIAKIHFSQFAVLAVTIIPLVKIYGIVGAGISTLVAVLASAPLVIYYLRKLIY